MRNWFDVGSLTPIWRHLNSKTVEQQWEETFFHSEFSFIYPAYLPPGINTARPRAALFIQTEQRIIQSQPSNPEAWSHLCVCWRVSNGLTIRNHMPDFCPIFLTYRNQVKLISSSPWCSSLRAIPLFSFCLYARGFQVTSFVGRYFRLLTSEALGVVTS